MPLNEAGPEEVNIPNHIFKLFQADSSLCNEDYHCLDKISQSEHAPSVYGAAATIEVLYQSPT